MFDVPSRVRSVLFLQKVHLHLQPPDFLVQRRRQSLRVSRAPGTPPHEHLRGILHQVSLPLRDLRRMNLVARRHSLSECTPFTASSATFALNSFE